jgi:hypothetical protein
MTGAAHWRRDLRASTRAVLASLGDDPRQIAASLEKSGVRATPRDTNDCAIAVFLGAVLATDPCVRSVWVSGHQVVLSPTQRWHRCVTIRLPESLRRFVSLFDRGEFPQLMRTRGHHRCDPSRWDTVSIPGE